MKVYHAIANVSASLAKQGISKDRKNQQQGYQFRGIDDVYSALAPILAENKLVIIPRFVTKQTRETPSKSGGVLFYTTVEGEFDVVSAEDGSKHTARTFGEAMDSGDKRTNKAMSAAYKYLAFQLFCIPTEGDNDADAHSPAPASPINAPATPKPQTPAQPAKAAPAATQTATPAQREKMLKNLSAAGIDGMDVLEYARKAGIITAEQSAQEWPLEKVPTTQAQMSAVKSAVADFLNGGEAKSAI